MISQYNSDGLQTLLRLLNEANFGPSIFWSSRTTVDASWLEPVISMVFQILKWVNVTFLGGNFFQAKWSQVAVDGGKLS